MTELATPTASRIQRARWLDPKLVVGVLFVLLSVVVGAKVVAEADDSVPVWQLTHDLGQGSTLTSGDLVRRDVRLPGGAGDYVVATGEMPVGYVLVRPVGHDELLPRRAVARAQDATLRRLSIEVDQVTADGLEAGSVVDVYVVPEAAGTQAALSAEVLTDVTVAAVARDGGGLGASTRAGGVTLLVAPDDARRVLDAQSRGTVQLLGRDLSPTAVAPAPS